MDNSGYSHYFMDSGLSHLVYAGWVYTCSSGNRDYHDFVKSNQGKMNLSAKFFLHFQPAEKQIAAGA